MCIRDRTYAMLEDARRVAADGVDVVVGIVETHGRAVSYTHLDVYKRQISGCSSP